MQEIIFLVEESDEGGYLAKALGEAIFTDGKSAKNLTLKKGESVTFRYRIVIDNGNKSISPEALNKLSDNFAK